METQEKGCPTRHIKRQPKHKVSEVVFFIKRQLEGSFQKTCLHFPSGAARFARHKDRRPLVGAARLPYIPLHACTTPPALHGRRRVDRKLLEQQRVVVLDLFPSNDVVTQTGLELVGCHARKVSAAQARQVDPRDMPKEVRKPPVTLITRRDGEQHPRDIVCKVVW